MPKKLALTVIALVSFFSLLSCAEKQEKKAEAPEGQIALSYYPSGEVRETAIQKGKKPNIATLTQYEYFRDGKRKKEYNFKDNHYYGKWFYWYPEGNVLASGNFTAKSIDTFNGIGNAIYFWPDGNKMMSIDKRSTIPEVIYFTRKGETFTNENLPRELSTDIKQTLASWANAGLITNTP